MFKIVIDSVSKDSGFQLPVEPATSSLQAACKLLENYEQCRAFFKEKYSNNCESVSLLAYSKHYG